MADTDEGIVVDRLTKRYGRTTAVDQLSFAVRPGVITAFLGPNGAGKTTTMKAMLGLLTPTSGRVLVNGGRYRDLAAPWRVVGSMLETQRAHPGRTARNHLRWLAHSNGIPAGRVPSVLELVGLAQVADRTVRTFSLGMSQRLGVAAALLGDPGILLLDEPVNGLDPEGIVWMRELLRDLADRGRAVLIASHLLAEVQRAAHRVVVLGRGRLLADDTLSDFVAQHGGGGDLEDAFLAVTSGATARTPATTRLEAAR
jgi:ABC-2 type transport system ATP-binding protein